MHNGSSSIQHETQVVSLFCPPGQNNKAILQEEVSAFPLHAHKKVLLETGDLTDKIGFTCSRKYVST